MKYLRVGAAISIAGFSAVTAQADQTEVSFTGAISTQPDVHYAATLYLNSISSQITADTFASYKFNYGVLDGYAAINAVFRYVPSIFTNFENFHIDPNTVTLTKVVHPAPQTWTLAVGGSAKLVFKNGAYTLDFGDVLTDTLNSAPLSIANASAPVDGETLNGGLFAPRFNYGELDFSGNLQPQPFDIGGGKTFTYEFGFNTAGLTTGDYYSTATLDTSRYLFGNAETGDTFTNVSIHARVVDVLPVAGVPEPAAWTMMIAGFGFVGSAMRRRVLQVA